MDWEPTHLQYLECAFNLYTVLLQDEAGIQFLNSDRRGMLFVEIAQEIDLLCAPQSRSKSPKRNHRMYIIVSMCVCMASPHDWSSGNCFHEKCFPHVQLQLHYGSRVLHHLRSRDEARQRKGHISNPSQGYEHLPGAHTKRICCNSQY